MDDERAQHLVAARAAESSSARVDVAGNDARVAAGMAHERRAPRTSECWTF